MKILIGIVSCLFCLIHSGSVSAQIQCEDVPKILNIEMSISNLDEKYNGCLNTNIMSQCDRCFYRVYLEDYYDDYFECILSGDDSLLGTYIDFVLSQKNSADEAIPGILGSLFLHKTTAVLQSIKSYSRKDREYIAESILYGVQNYGGFPREVQFDIKHIQAVLRKAVYQEE